MKNQTKVDGYALIATAVDECRYKERQMEDLIDKHLDLKWYQKIKNHLIAWAVISLFVWAFTATKDEKATSTASKKENVMITTEEAEIYAKPNDKSNVDFTANAGAEFEVTKRTKYFAEVKFIANDSLEHKGYIKLKKLKEK